MSVFKPVFRPAFRLPAGGRVIVASEDVSRRDALVRALTRDGHRVAEAKAPLELFVLAGITGPSLRHPRADVIVADVSGARWATPELLDALHTDLGERIPVVALVDPANAHARAECERLGVAAVVDLPVDDARLRAEVLAVVQPFHRSKEGAMHKLRLSLALASALVVGVAGAGPTHAAGTPADPPPAVTLFGKTWTLDVAPAESPVSRWLRQIRGRLDAARASMRASN